MFNNSRNYLYGNGYGSALPQYGGFDAQGMYPQQPMMNAQQQMPQPLTVRIVASREEAVAVPVDFMGNAIYMHDVAHGRIYRKAWNVQNGAPEFDEYGILPKAPEVPAPQPIAYATETQVRDLEARFTELESYIKNNV